MLLASNATVVSGNGSIIKDGTGTLSLRAGNTFTGPVQVNAGVLTVASPSGLGAAGAGNETTIASGTTLALGAVDGGTTTEDFTLSGAGAAGQLGALTIGGAGASWTLGGVLRLGADATIARGIPFGGNLTLDGQVGASDDALAILTINSDSLPSFAFANTATFTTELAGTTPGASGHDQLKVIGPVDLGNATLNVVPSFTPAVGDKFTIVDNDGAEAISGTFAGLSEGAIFEKGGVNFIISYAGGTNNNDVVLTVDSLVEVPVLVTLSADGKTATFTDVDGDLVTVKTTKGAFQQSDFRVVKASVGLLAAAGQLQLINLTTHPADFVGASISVTAKPGQFAGQSGLLGGNGFVNVGYINATGIDLGTVKIAGDLGRIAAGTVGGNVNVPGIKSLDVQSIGLLGTSTQASGGSGTSNIEGAMPKLAVKGDVRGSILLSGADDGRLGSASIGGSLAPNLTVGGFLKLRAEAGIGSVKIGGDIRSSPTNGVTIDTDGGIGSVNVGGSIAGFAAPGLVAIQAFGQGVAPAKGTDLAIKTLKVGGSVEHALISLGDGAVRNADASIGSIIVGGDWIASDIQAGISGGNDFQVGNNDDVKVSGGNTRDNPAIFSSIGSICIKGQAIGTATTTDDMFGVVAERIGKAKVGGRTFAFKDGTNEAFFAAPTADGAGTENPAFDFTIRELGSTTPVVALGAPNLVVSADGKTVTFTDVDGDLVTAKRSSGAFQASDFNLTPAPAGGGQLSTFTISSTGNAPINVTLTAKPGAGGGNGFVNVGLVVLSFAEVGNLSIAGDVGQVFSLILQR